MPESSLGGLLSELVEDLGRLIRQELRLAQSELAAKLHQAEVGFYVLLAGLMLAFATLLALLWAAFLGLSEVMPAWGASLVVALVLAPLAAVLIRQGRRSLRPGNLIPAYRSISTNHREDRQSDERKQKGD